MSKCAVIVTGGVLEEELVLETIKNLDTPWIIGVDRGVEFLYRHNIVPSYIVGDFDSLPEEIVEYYKTETKVPVREYNPVKDASDTEIAIRLGMTLGCTKLIVLGATGGRLDHLWANVQTLMIPFKAGVEAIILDSQNKIRLIGGETHLKKEEAYGKYEEAHVVDMDREIFTINNHFDHEHIFKGATVPLQNEDGNHFWGRVIDITDEKVKMDLNHPLAGKPLNFKGHIVENRDATEEEVRHMIKILSGEACGCGCGHDDCDCHHDHDNCDCHHDHHHGDGCGCGHCH